MISNVNEELISVWGGDGAVAMVTVSCGAGSLVSTLVVLE